MRKLNPKKLSDLPKVTQLVKNGPQANKMTFDELGFHCVEHHSSERAIKSNLEIF